MRNEAILTPRLVRLLVIGGTGRLGRLLRPGWRASGLVPVIQARGAGAVSDLRFDPLAEPEAFARAAQAADVVLILAGPTAGTPEDLAVHTTLAQAAVRAAQGVRPVLVASSAAVYGPEAAAAGPLREDGPTGPVSDYGRAKLAMEQAIAAAPGTTILRIGNVAGADALLGRPAPEGGRVLDICADGHAPRRSYIGPQALARALARLARLAVAGADLPGVINLALPGVVGMEALLEAAGAPWRARPAPSGVLPVVELCTRRAVALGLVPEGPATAAALIADLARLPEAAR